MMPVNQFIMGGDPLLSSQGFNIEEQLRMLEARKQQLESMKQLNPQAIVPTSPIWDEIDSEINVLSIEQRQKLFENKEYVELYTQLQEIVNSEMLNLVKAKIEASPNGNQILKNQLSLLKSLKSKIVEDTNREMDLFMKFREYSKTNPGVTYEEFIKSMQ